MPKTSRKTGTVASTIFAILILVAYVLITLNSDNQSQETTTQSPPIASNTIPVSSLVASDQELPSWLEIYFTNPNPPDDLDHGIDQYVVDGITKAKKTIDVTSFDLNLPSGVNALAAAAKRGVKVRVVYDGENGSLDLENEATNNEIFNAITVLKKAGVKLVDGGRSNGLMHDKIIILDSKILYVGSWNLSYNDTFRNNNNLLVITAPELIENYQAKFNEMFVDQQFGANAEIGAVNPSMVIDGVQVENYFSPPDEVMEKLVQYVSRARNSIHFIIFTYTDKNLADAMIGRSKAKVDVQGVIENRGASQGAMVPLFCAKLPVKVDGNKYTMHHKIIIIDGQLVITGSYNFTKSADTSNDDNILVIHSPAVANLYEQEYQRILANANVPENVDCNK